MNDALLRLARRQHGLVTARQVAAAGHRNLVRGRLESGEWVEEQPGVVRSALWTPSFEGRLAAVRLSLARPGKGKVKDWCFSHTTAARLRRFAVPDSDAIHVWLPTSRPGAGLRGVVRHIGQEPHIGAYMDREPVTSLTTTVLQCADVLGADDLLSLIEDLLRREQTTVPWLRESLGRGRSGSCDLRSALDVLDTEGTDKWMRVLVGKLVTVGLPEPELEYAIHADGRLVALLDGYFPAAKLGLEVDDWLTHGSRGASEKDRRRDAFLKARFDITTLRTTPKQLRDDAATFVQNVELTYERALGVAAAQAGE